MLCYFAKACTSALIAHIAKECNRDSRSLLYEEKDGRDNILSEVLNAENAGRSEVT